MFTYKVEVFYDGEWRSVNRNSRLEDGAGLVGLPLAEGVFHDMLSNGLFKSDPDTGQLVRHRVAARLTARRVAVPEPQVAADVEARESVPQ